MKTLLYTASDGGFNLKDVPLGGAAPICNFLTEAWQSTGSFQFRLLSPQILGSDAPRDQDLLRYTAKQYYQFTLKFEQAATAEILRHDPRETVVLSNDMPDAPAWPLLAEKGYPLYCISHMNMVHVLTHALTRETIQPETAAAVYRSIHQSRFRRLLPGFLRLIFLKQEETLTYCRGIIVPSEGMKRRLLRMYSQAVPDKIHVVPWGTPPDTSDEPLIQAKARELRRQHDLKDGMPVLMALSRISVEKGQDRLLKALALWEMDPGFPASGAVVFICGTAGYRHAQAYEKNLIRHAQSLRKVRVIFPGYVYGLEKQAYFRLANVYVFPSRMESYGLTLMEAFGAGLPAVAAWTDGTEQLLQKEFGELLPAAAERDVPRLLKDAIKRMLADPEGLRTKGQKAQAFAQAHPFSETADQIARLMLD